MKSIDENLRYLKSLEEELKSSRVLSPRVEAEMLISHFGKIAKLAFYTGAQKLGATALRSIQKALKDRKTGRPLQHLTGEAPFYGRAFIVNRHTLIPRPETEVLVEAALRLIKESGGKTNKILDIGTGSGCIAISLTLEYPACKMTALDASGRALDVARKNAARFGLKSSIRFVQSRFFRAFDGKNEGPWDMIVSNPPYVPREELKRLSKEVRSEPRLALDGGPRGLRVIEELLKKAPAHLIAGGWLLVEIGKGQSTPLKKILKKNKAFAKEFGFVKDLNGIDRILVARKNGSTGSP